MDDKDGTTRGQNISAQAIYDRGRDAAKGSLAQLDNAVAAAFELYEYWKDGTQEQKGEVEALPGYKVSKRGEHYRFFPFVGLIFPEATRTSRGLYASVLRLADDQGIRADGLPAFIAARGGLAAMAQAERGKSKAEPPKSNPKLEEAAKVNVTKLLCGVEGEHPEYVRALLQLMPGEDGCYRLLHVRPETEDAAHRFIKSPLTDKRAGKRKRSEVALQ